MILLKYVLRKVKIISYVEETNNPACNQATLGTTYDKTQVGSMKDLKLDVLRVVIQMIALYHSYVKMLKYLMK